MTTVLLILYITIPVIITFYTIVELSNRSEIPNSSPTVIPRGHEWPQSLLSDEVKTMSDNTNNKTAQ